MSNKGQLLQDPFLNALRREHVPVSIYLVNGIKLQGQIESFDQYDSGFRTIFQLRPQSIRWRGSSQRGQEPLLKSRACKPFV